MGIKPTKCSFTIFTLCKCGIYCKLLYQSDIMDCISIKSKFVIFHGGVKGLLDKSCHYCDIRYIWETCNSNKLVSLANEAIFLFHQTDWWHQKRQKNYISMPKFFKIFECIIQKKNLIVNLLCLILVTFNYRHASQASFQMSMPWLYISKYTILLLVTSICLFVFRWFMNHSVGWLSMFPILPTNSPSTLLYHLGFTHQLILKC